jgi:LuxR family maltose regulon positive regulatory protein
VPRQGLVERAEASLATPVIVVSAGPGWGKTTLLAQWASQSHRPFGWVHVDERDNDPIVLLTYVAVALDRISPLDPSVFGALASPGVSVEATVVPRVGAALATMGREVVLVLDDLHVLENPVCLDAVASLTTHVSPGSHIALSARGEPALPLGALRAKGLALEIGPDELRMDEAEARQLLNAAGVNLPDDQIADLNEQTEGWSAGLYLAALSIRARGTEATGAATFSGRDRLVSDYLWSELLAHVSADEFRFLTRTAVLERLSGPLCDAVLETSGSAATLESLTRSNLFLIPLDPTGDWYRYHHLFRDLLRAELVRADAELVPRLLARATDWCEANGQPESAIAYAQAAGDVDRVALLVGQWAPPVYQSGRVATAERWLDWVEEKGALERNALVAVLGAVLASLWGRSAQAERWAEVAERAVDRGRLPDGSSSIDPWLSLMRAQLCQEGVARMRAEAELALRTLGEGSRARPHALLLLGAARLLAGEIDEADDLFADVVEEGLGLGTLEEVAVALGERAVISIGRGAWVEGEEFVDRALQTIRRSRMQAYPTSAFVNAVAARVALHREQAQRAQEFLARAQRLRPRLTYALPWIAVAARLELARAYLALADAGGARTMLREIDLLLRRRPNLGRLTDEVQELRSSLLPIRVKAPGASTLTAAELRVIPYLATHLAYREIGERLSLSRHTVKSHSTAIYRKLNVTSRTDAMERARALGLL